jgi:hypothetical protein
VTGNGDSKTREKGLAANAIAHSQIVTARTPLDFQGLKSNLDLAPKFLLLRPPP